MLAGRRLELRSLAEKDTEALFAAVAISRSELKRRFRWAAAVKSVNESASFIKGIDGRAGVFGVFERKTRALAGVAALKKLPERPGLGEADLWIRSDRRDKGYAVEAGRLLLAQAFRGGVHKIFTRIEPVNRAGRRVIQKLGFRYEGCLRKEKRLNGRWVDQECWGLLREEWRE